jgi:AMP phosphorylase
MNNLKIKFLDWSAGIPVAMLNEKTATELGIHTKDRVSITTLSKPEKTFSTIVDTVKDLISPEEILVSSELKSLLDLKEKQFVKVVLAENSESLNYIKKKLEGKELSEEEIKLIVSDVVSNALSESEVAMFVSAMYIRGMNEKETTFLIRSILKTGNTISFSNKYVVDKHSIGGIPGNRATPIVVSICAAEGLIFPKTSSRAITSSAGTADVIETIARVDFSIEELKKIIAKTNACLVWGGGLGMVPADDKIIQTEKLLKLDPEAQLLASIISKKLAAGSKYVLIDIPYGKYAKVDKAKGLHLKERFEKMGKIFNIKIKAVLTKGDEPMGFGVGPALELNDVIHVLDQTKVGPRDLEEKSLFLAGEIFEMVGMNKKGQGINRAREVLYSGRAYSKFVEIIEAQGGKVREIEPATFKKIITAPSSGKIKEINNKLINSLARIAGCPADKVAGLYIYISLGDSVEKGSKLLTIYSKSKVRLLNAIDFYNKNSVVRIE